MPAPDGGRVAVESGNEVRCAGAYHPPIRRLGKHPSVEQSYAASELQWFVGNRIGATQFFLGLAGFSCAFPILGFSEWRFPQESAARCSGR